MIISDAYRGSGDAIFIPPNCWNKPDWDTDCSVLSILFGRRQLGLSLVSKRKGEASLRYPKAQYSNSFWICH